ncbi:MAG TPA: hypothetical protein VJQ83_01105, partial [Tepidiformaceae bacterium]|nr:hypothetical protein [Tepidiformaceae bacterium]
MNRTQGRTGRRNNAPLRPPKIREGGSIPDVLFCLASGAFVLAVILLVSTFTNDNVAAGHEGTQLAQLFSAALIAASVFLGLVGILLLHGKQSRANHYSTP